MSNFLSEDEKNAVRSKVFYAAAKLFLERGYSNTTTRGLAEYAGVNVSAMNRHFGSKENILCELIRYVMKGQFRTARELVKDATEDEVLYYAVETALQLYMAESEEAVRELYVTVYSLPRASQLIYREVSEILLPKVFSAYLSEASAEAFYRMEIASGGIIRGYLSLPCGPEFPVEQKVARFLDAALRVYHVPEEKIREAIDFVSRYDFKTIAKQTVASMMEALEKRYDQFKSAHPAGQGDLLTIPKEESI